jgi:hypothetical protein
MQMAIRLLVNSFTHFRMKHSCLTSAQENENMWISSQARNNQSLLVFSF